MHFRAVLALVFVMLSPRIVAARCDPAGGDAADVAGARAAIAAACDCAGAPNHGSYVRCAREAAKAALTNQSCLGAVTRCAARSTCGRPGADACCQTSTGGVTRASIKSSAACRAPSGGSSCVSLFASACDACTATGCASPTSTPRPQPTPTPGCGNGIVDGGEECDAATCTAMIDEFEVESECGAPGTLHACECKNVRCGGCIGGIILAGAVLCWAGDQCAVSPLGERCFEGTCIPTACETASDCALGMCEDGRCCVADFESICAVINQFGLPCCGAAVCGAATPLGRCCLPTGEPCTDQPWTCCSGSCTAGSCD